jgi:hypothetical protein
LRSIVSALLKCPQVVGHVWIFRCQRLDVANFDVSWFYTRPFGACTEKPVAPPDHTRGMEGTAGNQKLDELAAAQIRSYDDALVCAISVQH